jgi:uncharacterized protein (UPF0179 family)
MSYSKNKQIDKQVQKESGEKEYIVTLALESKAEPGYEFYHDGHSPACPTCDLFTICMKNLEPHRTYRITEVNEYVHHQCPKGLYEGDLVVVKVKEPPLLVSFPARGAFEGINIKFHGQPCTAKSCKYYEACNPSSIVKGMPVKVVKIVKKLKDECQFHNDLALLEVKREKVREK